MTRFYPVYVRRSDGKSSTAGRGKREELNQPTEEQMDQKPDNNGLSDFYREVRADEAKHVDWRRKLGGMLARELQRKDNDVGHILVSFPEHYRLFEHIKKSEKDGKTEVKAKTHAAGGNDRQDAYLYGHPDGRRKRFRSPADFFPHLLWLVTDEAGDPDNCSCKLCCPEELDSIVPTTKVKTEPEKKQKPQIPQPVQAASLQPTSLPRPRSLDQQIDSQYGGFKYRPGELCWFRREAAWGLGVILRRWNNRSQQSYTVQPLCHPYLQLEPVIKSSEDEMRPWLSWSIPVFTFPGLNELQEPPRFDTVDWQGLVNGRYGTGGNLEVDGSILAAKSIDCSYTPFNQHSDSTYDGVFIGGEKIWVGEAVRLSYGTGTDILLVHSITEKKDTLLLTGDTYALTTVPHQDPSKPSPASPMANQHLPVRLTEDLAMRNAYSIPERKVVSFWKLTAVQQRVGLDQIKGRWYESSIWMPNLQPQAFTTMVGQGNIQELSLFMNARGDCLQANRAEQLPKAQKVNIRKHTRLEAFGAAVPRDAQIIEGSEAPSNDAIMLDPQFEAHHQNGDDGAMEQFMNMDAVDGQAGFDQAYQRY